VSLITEDGECTTEFRTRLNRGHAIGALLQKVLKSHSIPISMKIGLMKVLVWPAYGCESWTLRKNEETRLGAFDIKRLIKIFRVSRSATKTNKWVLNKAVTHRQNYEDSILWSHHEETRESGKRYNARKLKKQ